MLYSSLPISKHSETLLQLGENMCGRRETVTSQKSDDTGSYEVEFLTTPDEA
jgi:hypothetical protein